MKKRKLFSKLEDEILKEACEEVEQNARFFFKQLHVQYNLIKQKSNLKTQNRSLKAVMLRYKELFSQKKYWNFVFDQTMLNQAATSQTWLEISKLEIFQNENITHKELKQKFKTDMMRKYRVLRRNEQQKPDGMEPSYTIFRILINKERLDQLAYFRILNQNQYNHCLLGISYFKTSSYQNDTDRHQTRSFDSIQYLLSNLQINSNYYVHIIHKIKNFCLQYGSKFKQIEKHILQNPIVKCEQEEEENVKQENQEQQEEEQEDEEEEENIKQEVVNIEPKYFQNFNDQIFQEENS